MTAENSNRIQVLRGLAIIAVVFIHNTPGGLAQVFCRPLLNIAVGTFLFLSGMLSDAGRWRPLKRIRKVVIPYVIWTAVYVLINDFTSPKALPVVFVKRLVLGNSAAMMYYVWVYCQLTVLIPLVDRLARSRFKWIGLLISPAEIILMRLVPMLTGASVNRYVSAVMNISCAGWFIYFYLGYLIGNGYLKIHVQTRSLVLFWFASLLLQLAEGYWYYLMGVGNCGTQLKLSALVSGCLFVVLAFRYVHSESVPVPKLLKLLGDRSFGIFFSHMAVMKLLEGIPGYSVIPYPLDAATVLVLSVLFVSAVSKCLGRYSLYIAF